MILPISLIGRGYSDSNDYVRKVVLNESFSAPPEVSDVGWTGMFHHFGIEKSGDVAMLRLKGNATRSDTSWLATSVSLYHGEWNYTININGDPSNSNRIDLVVMSDQNDLKSNFNGYLLKAGENGSNDVIRLMRVDKGVMTPILSGTTSIANGGLFRIRIIRDPIGHWQLFVAESGDPFQFQGSIHDVTYGNLGYSGFRMIYTRTRNSDYAIGPIHILQTTPQILHADLSDPTLLRLKLDAELRMDSDVKLYVDGQTTPNIATISSSTVELALTNPLKPGRRNITIAGLTTTNGVFSDVEASISLDVSAVIHPRDILINEYMYYPPVDIPQFVELVNVSTNAINLRGWELRDNSTGNRSITSSDIWIEPGAYLVLTPDSSTLSAYYAAPNVRQMARFPFLNRGSKDAVILRAPGGLTIDSLAYTPSPAGDGVSIERISIKAPSWAPTNWKPSVHRRGATPGEPNSIPPEEPTAPTMDLAVLTAPQSLMLTFSSEIDITSIYNVSINGIRVPITPCASADWRVLLCSSAAVLPVEPDKPSFIEIEDVRSLFGNALPKSRVPISWTPIEGDILINEIMFNPLQARYDGGSDQAHYVELVNVRGHHVHVGDIQMKTKSTTSSTTSTITFFERDTLFIAPQSILVLHADTASTTASRLSRFFGLKSHSRYFRANRSTLSLNSTSGVVWVSASAQATIDSVRYDAEFHYPSVRDRRGVSLERIALGGSSVDPRNWGSHAGPLGGSPGQPNSIVHDSKPSSDSVVELYPNPFSPDNDGHEDVVGIRLAMPDPGWLTKVAIFDRYGRKVRTLADGERIGLSHEIFWNGLDDQNRRVFTGFYVVLVETWHVEQRKSQVYKKVVGLIHQPAQGLSFK